MVKQDELDGMPERPVEKVLTLLGAKTEAEREFAGREAVTFVVNGYVKETGTEYLEDEDNPVRDYVKIQVTSMKERK